MTRLTGFVGAACLLAARAAAHEHHGDEIPEGEVVSAEPLVRGLDLSWRR